MTFDEVSKLLEARGRVNWSGSDSFTTCCPAHADDRPSLSVTRRGKKLLMYCFAGCDYQDILTALEEIAAGKVKVSDRQRVEANDEQAAEVSRIEFEIRDTEGNLHATHVRVDRADGSKDVFWKGGLSGRSVTSLPLFGSEILRELPPDTPIVLTEGEKDAFSMWGKGYLALGTVCGAHTIPDDDVLRCLVGREVTLWADRDKPGRRHMARIKARLQLLNRKGNPHER